MQLAALREYAQKRDWKILNEFIDQGFSGRDTKRPAYTKMMQAAGKRRFDVLLVWKLDRLSRSLKDLVATLAKLQSLGIDFISYENQLDTSSPTGQLLFHIIGAMAEFERDIIRDRVKAGLEAARKKGKRLGRRPVAAYVIDQIKELKLQGLSNREIGRRLGISEGTVRNKLKGLNIVPYGLKVMKVKLWLRVENNNKYVQGKKRARESIERHHLREYGIRKSDKDGWEYELTIPYTDDKELDDTIYSLISAMDSTADDYHCFIETDITAVGSDRFW
jgi:DNA invertase Pin-like site-specific DNA recombinase